MAADGGVRGMVDRAGSEDRPGAAEQVFDLRQIAVAQHRSTACSGVTRALVRSTKTPVEAGLVGRLAGIDLKGPGRACCWHSGFGANSGGDRRNCRSAC